MGRHFTSKVYQSNVSSNRIRMDFLIDLDPGHNVIRLTVLSPIVDLQLAEVVYNRIKKISSKGGPYAAIFDHSAVRGTTLSLKDIRDYSHLDPCIPMGRPHVFVEKDGNRYGLMRVFQMYRFAYKNHRVEVVRTVEEAYDLVGARPEDFTMRLFPKWR